MDEYDHLRGSSAFHARMDRLKCGTAFMSPCVVQLIAFLDERISNKEDLREVLLQALKTDPQLQLQLTIGYLSPHSLIIHYQSVNRRLTADYLQLDSHEKILCVLEHIVSFHQTAVIKFYFLQTINDR